MSLPIAIALVTWFGVLIKYGPHLSPGLGFWLAAYLAMVPINDLATLPLPAPLNSGTTVVGIGLMAALAIRWFAAPENRPPLHLAVAMWFGFLSYSALSYAWSLNRSRTVEEVQQLIFLIALATLASSVRFREKEIRFLLPFLAASGGAAGLIALIQLQTGALAGQGSAVGRFAVVSHDPNHTAAALVLPGLAGIFLIVDRTEIFGQPSLDRLWRLVTVGLTLSAIALTASRGGILALIAGLGLIFAYICITRRPRLLLGVVAVAVLLTGVPSVARSGAGTTGRSSIWSVWAVGCDSYCLTGAGLGSFPEVHGDVVVQRPELGRNRIQIEAHNMWLGLTVEVGVFATLLLTFSLLVVMLLGLHSGTTTGVVAAVGIVAMAIANLTVDSFLFKHFWLSILAAVIASNTIGDRRQIPKRSLVAR